MYAILKIDRTVFIQELPAHYKFDLIVNIVMYVIKFHCVLLSFRSS